jgi:hypothetical protein
MLLLPDYNEKSRELQAGKGKYHHISGVDAQAQEIDA